jgi:hypothetical protein
MARDKSIKGKKSGSRLSGTPEEMFWEYTIELPNGCIQWMAGVDDGYYGEFRVAPGEKVHAHRYAWELDRGPIPEGFEIDHTCCNRGCVNVNHMQLVTTAEDLDGGTRREAPWELSEQDINSGSFPEYVMHAR